MYLASYICTPYRERSSVGRARPCQGRGRGFESRLSLQTKTRPKRRVFSFPKLATSTSNGLKSAVAAAGLPEHSSAAHTHVERVLESELRNLQRAVAQRQSGRLHAVYLIAKYQQDPRGRSRHSRQRNRRVGLLNRVHRHSGGAGSSNRIRRINKALPGYRLGGAQCHFVELNVRWAARIATQPQLRQPKGIGGAKERAHVVRASQILKQSHHRNEVGGRRGAFRANFLG